LRLPSADITDGGPKRSLETETFLSRAEPKVRIHSPPPENQAKSVDRAALSRISIFSFTR
jgi:hypothetical protein